MIISEGWLLHLEELQSESMGSHSPSEQVSVASGRVYMLQLYLGRLGIWDLEFVLCVFFCMLGFNKTFLCPKPCETLCRLCIALCEETSLWRPSHQCQLSEILALPKGLASSS